MPAPRPASSACDKQPTRGGYAFGAVFALLAAVSLIPIWVGAWLPMGDLGGHVELMDIMARYRDPSTLYEAIYTTPSGLGPNVLLLYLAGLVQGSVDTYVLAKLCVSFYVVGLPLSVLALCCAFERDRHLSLLSFLVVYGALFNLGALNFLVALPLLFASVAWMRAFVDRGHWGFGLLAMLTYFALFHVHVLAFLMGMPIGVALSIAFLRKPRDLVRALVLAPSSILLVRWAYQQFVALEATVAGRTFGTPSGQLGLVYLDIGSLLWQLYHWSLQFFRDYTDEVFAAGLGVLWLAALVASFRASSSADRTPRPRGVMAWAREYALEWITLCCAVAYFALPSHMNEMALITERVPTLVLVFALPLSRVTFTKRGAALFAGICFVWSVGYSVAVAAKFDRFNRELVRQLPEQIEALGPRARLGYVMWELSNPLTYRGPLWHLPQAVVTSRNGGLTDDSFAIRPYTPIQYRPNEVPPQLPLRFWQSGAVAAYDAVLLRTGGVPMRALRSPAFRLRYRDGVWWLFDVVRPRHPKGWVPRDRRQPPRDRRQPPRYDRQLLRHRGR